MKYLIIVLVLFSVINTSCVKKQELTKNDIRAIKQLENEYVKGWFADDQQNAVLNTFEENAVFIPHHGDKPVIGTGNLADFFWPDGIGGIVHKFNHFPDTIEGNDEIAWIRGRFDIKYSWINEQDTTTTMNEGNYVLIARKQKNDEWKIATFIFNDPVAQVED